MKDKQNEPHGEMLALAQALNGLNEQSCSMLKPIVDDCCKHPESVDEKELEHVFDLVLNVSCCPKGKRLFNRLCKSFGRIYPDCVKDYIGFDREMWGDQDGGHGRDNQRREKAIIEVEAEDEENRLTTFGRMS